MALDIAQCNDERQRLEWSFRSDIVAVGKFENESKLCRMWDVDDSGCINLQEMTNIVATMDDVEGVEQEPKVSPSDMIMVMIMIMMTAWPAVWTTECPDESEGDIRPTGC